MPGPGIKVAKPSTPSVVKNTAKKTVFDNLINDKSGKSSSNDSNVPRAEQTLMNESLQVPHPFEKGKTVGWGEFKGMAKTHATQFKDAGILDIPTYQKKAYDTALGALKEFPEQAVTNYQNTRVAERTTNNIAGVVKKPMGGVVAGGTPVYKKGTAGIKVKPKGNC